MHSAYKIRICFVAGTLVKTREGYRRIEEIEIGDEVLSWNENTNRVEYNKVVRTFKKQTKEIVRLEYTNGSVIETTREHPFYVSGAGWTPAQELHSGMLLTQASTSPSAVNLDLVNQERSDQSAVIKSVTVVQRSQTVYNFEVAEAHTYYVGIDEVLVHNECEMLTNIAVTSPFVHAYVIATPDDQEAFADYFAENKESGKVFQKLDEEGNPVFDENGKPVYSIIFRAGPDSEDMLSDDLGYLSNIVRIEQDYETMHRDEFLSRQTITHPSGNDTMLINKLIEADANFTENYLEGTTPEYEAMPDEGEFENNSNSYIHGLLKKVGVDPPPPRSRYTNQELWAPGWDKPVTSEHFNPPCSEMTCKPKEEKPGCGVTMSCPWE